MVCQLSTSATAEDHHKAVWHLSYCKTMICLSAIVDVPEPALRAGFGGPS